MIKIFLVGQENIDKVSLGEGLVNLDDNLRICRFFISDQSIIHDYTDYMDMDNINLCCKNNAILYINSEDNIYNGITLDSFYNGDIICIDTVNFNLISNKVINENNDILIAYIDSKDHHNVNVNNEICEYKYLMERIEEFNMPMLYFLNESTDEILHVLLDYITNEENRQEIIQNYS